VMPIFMEAMTWDNQKSEPHAMLFRTCIRHA